VTRPEFTLHDLLHNSVERDPAHVAIVDGSAEYTYEDLARQSASLCAALQDEGVRKGDRVGILLEKTWEAIVAMLAASMAGAAYVNINPLFKAPQVRYIADDCDIRVLIGDSGKLEELEPGTIAGTAFYKGEEPSPEAAGSLVDVTQALSSGDTPKETRQVSEVDLGTILYTSGSTGMPKGGSPDCLDVSGEHARGSHPLGAPPQLRRRHEPVHYLPAGGGHAGVAAFAAAGGPLEGAQAAPDHGRHRGAAAMGAPLTRCEDP
jgi:non-ribosomal peptide synthetase component F